MQSALQQLMSRAKALKQAEQQKAQAARAAQSVPQLEIDGLILDETRSKIGKDFYDTFYQAWQQPQDAYGFTIRIIEKPVPGLGSLIEVNVNQTLAYQARLQPRAETIEASGKEAVLYAQYYLQNQPALRIY